MEYHLEEFREGLKELGIELTEEQIEKFLNFYEFLVEKNRVVNLTAITEFSAVIKKHFLDSLSLCRVCDLNQNIKIMDLGTGAGFPGIPLKIAYPGLQIVLADSLNKRIRFLEELTERLGLKGVETVHARAEELGRNKKYREQSDLCVSRAVAHLSSLSEYCLPLVKKGGAFIAYKSGEADGEIAEAGRAVSILGGQIENTDRFEMYGQRRTLIVIRKQKKTPPLYPRKAGTPTKMPL